MRFISNALAVILISTFMWGCSSAQPKSGPAQPTPTTTSSSDPASHVETGKASFYADHHQSKKTANGEIYDHKLNTAAHRTLPFGTQIRVTNIENGKSIVVTINDRGPFIKNRVLDLSRSAFDSIADVSTGVIEVKIEIIE